ncbi:MAG: hypothetical protein MJ180_04515 [Candidatus Gastranaerophilales bacterium]|nr:hypothetical protein [Candidatus Gastranaerophilales bacterium]
MVEAVSLNQKQIAEQQGGTPVQVQGNNGNIFDALGNFAGNVSAGCDGFADKVAKIDLQNTLINNFKMRNTFPPLFCWGGYPVCMGGTMVPMYSQPIMQTPVFTTSYIPTTQPTTQVVVQPQMNPFYAPMPFHNPLNDAFNLTRLDFLPQLQQEQKSLYLLPMYQDPPYSFQQQSNNGYSQPQYVQPGIPAGQQGAQQGIQQTVPASQPQGTQTTQQIPAPTTQPASTGVMTFGQANNNPQQVNVDAILHPEKYVQQQQNNARPQEEVVTEYRAMEEDEPLPDWYNNLINKPESELTEEEKELKPMFQKMFTTYSPHAKDRYGNYSPALSKTAQKALNLYYTLCRTNSWESVERFIKECPAEELAAIDYHWMNMRDVNGNPIPNLKPLREMIKNSTYWYVSLNGALNENNDDCNRILDLLDKKTEQINPRSMAYAFYQALENSHVNGLSMRKDTVERLLKELKGKKEYSLAVQDEFKYAISKWASTDNQGDSLMSILVDGKYNVTNDAQLKRIKELAEEVLNVQ